MRRVLLATVVVLAGVAGAGEGAARSTRAVQLDPGDTFTVVGSHVACVARKQLVACGLFKRNRLVAGTYAATLTGKGEALLAKIRPDGTPVPVVYRKPSVVRRTYALRPKDVAYVLGTKIFCVVSAAPAAGVLCDQYDVARRRYVPGSYAVGMTDRAASLGRLDAAGKLKLIRVLLQSPL